MALDRGLISRHFLQRTARWRKRSLEGMYPDAEFRVRHYSGRLYRWAVWKVEK